MKRSREVLWYSAGGIIALFVVIIAANFLISAFNARADLRAIVVWPRAQVCAMGASGIRQLDELHEVIKGGGGGSI